MINEKVQKQMQGFYNKVTKIVDQELITLCETVNEKHPFDKMIMFNSLSGDVTENHLSFGIDQDLCLGGSEYATFKNFMLNCKSKNNLTECEREDIAVLFENLVGWGYGYDWTLFVTNNNSSFDIQVKFL